MTPQTVNAVNLPAMNAMNFPAAILQPPYFDPNRPLRHGLRRHGRHHRPRGEPQLRQPGRAVRLQRPAAQLVDAGGLQALRGLRRRSSSRSTTATSRSPTSRSRAGRRWARTSPTWPALPRRTTPGTAPSAASRRRRWTASPATSSSSSASPRAGARKAREPALRNRILTDGHAPAQYRASHRAEHRRLVRRVRREGGADALPGAGGAGAGVVSGQPAAPRRR